MRPRTRNPIRKRRKSRNLIEEEEALFDDPEVPDLGHDKPQEQSAAPRKVRGRRKKKPISEITVIP